MFLDKSTPTRPPRPTGEVPGRGRAPAVYLEAAGAWLARREVAEGVPLELNLHVAGHPGQLSRAEAAHRGQL